MKKTRLTSAWAAAAILALVGCQDDHVLLDNPYVASYNGSGRVPITVTANMSEGDWLGDRADTRTENQALNSTTFSLATATNLTSSLNVVVDNGSGSYSSFNYGVTTANLNLIAPSPVPYFPAGATSVHVYAWYPYAAGTEIPASFSVQTDQKSDANYCLSDLMISAPVTLTRASQGSGWDNTTATLNMAHKLSKIMMNITIPSDLTVKEVNLLNVKPTVAVSTTKTADVVTAIDLGAASGSASAINVYADDNGVSNGTLNVAAIIPPQTIQNAGFIRITATDDQSQTGTITYAFDETGKAFASGTDYTVAITVDKTQVGATLTISGWTSTGALTLPVRKDNQITLGTHEMDVNASFSDQTTDYIAVSNVKGTLSWDANTPASVDGITPEIDAVNNKIRFNISKLVVPGTYTFTLRDSGTASYSASTCVVTVTVSGSKTGDLSNIKRNPLWWVAQYNVASDKTSFVAAHATESQYVFNFADAQSISIPGYHLPTYWEQVSVLPSNSETANGTNIFSLTNSAASPYSFPEVHCVVGGAEVAASTSYFFKNDDKDYYAVRFVGTDYASAWHYQWIEVDEYAGKLNNKVAGLLIESYLLAANQASTADQAKTTLSALKMVGDDGATFNGTTISGNVAPVTATGNSGYVQRFLPACGYRYGSSGTADSVVGTGGYYWSATELSSTIAWYWDFYSGNLHEYSNNKTYGFSVRLFRDF